MKTHAGAEYSEALAAIARLEAADAATNRELDCLAHATEVVGLFGARILRRYGQVPTPDFLAWIESECFRMNALFIGPGLPDSMPFSRSDWHTPARLGHQLAISLHISGEERLAARDAFAILAAEICELMRSLQGAGAEALTQAVDARVAEFSRLLVSNAGMPDVGSFGRNGRLTDAPDA